MENLLGELKQGGYPAPKSPFAAENESTFPSGIKDPLPDSQVLSTRPDYINLMP